jgi:hypothetical protein
VLSTSTSASIGRARFLTSTWWALEARTDATCELPSESELEDCAVVPRGSASSACPVVFFRYLIFGRKMGAL